MPLNCPWDGFSPAALHFCEAELCAWIEQPTNTWSNVAYILIGAWLIRKATSAGRSDLAIIGVIEILIGIGSFFFHMSSTHIGEVVDVGCMFLLVGYVLVVNMHRFLVKTRGEGLTFKKQLVVFGGLVTTSVGVLIWFKGDVGVVLFAIQAVVAGHLEMRIRRTNPDGISYRPLAHLVLAFAVAWAVWWVDILGIKCDPTNHIIQGHAVWHVINAFVFVFLYQFYRQYPAEALSPGA